MYNSILSHLSQTPPPPPRPLLAQLPVASYAGALLCTCLAHMLIAPCALIVLSSSNIHIVVALLPLTKVRAGAAHLYRPLCAVGVGQASGAAGQAALGKEGLAVGLGRGRGRGKVGVRARARARARARVRVRVGARARARARVRARVRVRVAWG
jgi:hypothetical protein